MSIRLRLAVVFAVASAVLFALGGWLFVSRLSASLQSTIDSQLAVQLVQAPRYLPDVRCPRRRVGRPGARGVRRPGRRPLRAGPGWQR